MRLAVASVELLSECLVQHSEDFLEWQTAQSTACFGLQL